MGIDLKFKKIIDKELNPYLFTFTLIFMVVLP